MTSTKKSEKKQCSRNIFSLKPKSQSCYFQQSIIISFCDQINGKIKNATNTQGQCYYGPIFNTDKNFLTSSFIINSQKKKYINHQNKGAVQNQQRYQNFNEQKTQMLLPKPNSKYMYCNVCKQKYDDYRQHIVLEKHKKKIKGTIFNDYIVQLSEKYKLINTTFKFKQKFKEKQLTAQFSNVIIIDQSSIEEVYFEKCNKKVKIDIDADLDNKLLLQENINNINKSFFSNNDILNQAQGCYWNMMLPMVFTNAQYPIICPVSVFNPYQLDLNTFSNTQSQVQNYLKFMIPSSGFTYYQGNQSNLLPLPQSINYNTIKINN